VRHEAHII